MKFAFCIAVLTMTTPLGAAQSAPESAQALTNWVAAALSFKAAGTFIGQEKYAQARAELESGSTNLPAPYQSLAEQFLARIDSALKLSTNHADPKKVQALISLCTDLRAYQAALKLQTNGSAGVPRDELADDPLYAWRLFGSGDAKAALAEYRRRLEQEQVEFWQDYYRGQIRLIEQRPAAMTNAQLALEATKQHFLKGLEAPADLFGALSELTRVLPHVKSASEAIPVYQLIFKCLEGLGDQGGREAWQAKFLAGYESDPEICALVYVDRGQKAFHRKDLNAAEALFRKACSDYPNTSVYADALYGLGIVLQEEHRYGEAIAEYAKIFSSNANEDLLDRESSEDYPNYRFKAAMRTSECYEATKDLKKALEYALMARDKYKFVSYCKDCLFKTRQNVEKRVQELEKAVNKPAAPTTVP